MARHFTPYEAAFLTYLQHALEGCGLGSDEVKQMISDALECADELHASMVLFGIEDEPRGHLFKRPH
jgi:hypothetical protein